jgi:protein-tyrosine phosphatase
MYPALYWIESPFPGKLAISARPRGGDWLEDEIAAWREAGVDAVTSLLTPDEVKDLDLSAEPSLSESHSIRFRSFPIPDRGVPSSQTKAASLIRTLKEDLEAGRNVTVHCRQGIGRSGLIAAGVLISAGMSSKEALRRIGEARGLPVPETSEQRDWIEQLSGALEPPSE